MPKIGKLYRITQHVSDYKKTEGSDIFMFLGTEKDSFGVLLYKFLNANGKIFTLNFYDDNHFFKWFVEFKT